MLAVDSAVHQFLEVFHRAASSAHPPNLGYKEPATESLPKPVPETYLGGRPSRYQFHASAAEWLNHGLAPPPPKIPAECGQPQALGRFAPQPKPLQSNPQRPPVSYGPIPPPGPPPKRLTTAEAREDAARKHADTTKQEASNTQPGRSAQSPYTPYFLEEEVDFDDDRTEEERAEDEKVLEETRKNMQVFLEAPEDVKRQMRTAAWKKCCARLEALRLNLLPAKPKVHKGKFEADLAAGFSHREAAKMQKGRVRAARHEAFLASEPRTTFEDLPRSWTNPKARTLQPGWLERKEAERREKRGRSQPAGKTGRAAPALRREAEDDNCWGTWKPGGQERQEEGWWENWNKTNEWRGWDGRWQRWDDRSWNAGR